MLCKEALWLDEGALLYHSFIPSFTQPLTHLCVHSFKVPHCTCSVIGHGLLGHLCKLTCANYEVLPRNISVKDELENMAPHILRVAPRDSQAVAWNPGASLCHLHTQDPSQERLGMSILSPLTLLLIALAPRLLARPVRQQIFLSPPEHRLLQPPPHNSELSPGWHIPLSSSHFRLWPALAESPQVAPYCPQVTSRLRMTWVLALSVLIPSPCLCGHKALWCPRPQVLTTPWVPGSFPRLLPLP